MTDPDVEAELASSPHATLVRTAIDYRIIHSRAIESFPLTDEGSDDAWERFRSLTRTARLDRGPTILLITAIGAAVGWFVLVVASSSAYALLASTDRTDASWLETLLAVSQYQHAFFALFAGSLGCYAAWWFYRKGLGDAGQA